MTATLHTPATLPPLPRPPAGEQGYAWIAQLTHWHPVPTWGRDGWPLGDWPHLVIAHTDPTDDDPHAAYGLAIYCEGDITTRPYSTRLARDLATDETAAWIWRHNDNGPDDLPESDDDLQIHHRGPSRT